MSSEEYLGEEDEYVYDDSLSRSSTSSTIPVNLSRTSTSTSTQAGTNTNLALSTAQSNLTGIRLIFRTFGNASSSAAVSTGEDTYSYDVFSTFMKLEKLITSVSEMLAITADDAFMLLSQYKWNRQLLEEAYFEDENKTREIAGVARDVPQEHPTGSTYLCPVELEQVSIDEIDAAPCGHWISNTGWTNYLTDSLTEFNKVTNTRCPTGCNQLVPPRLFITHLPTAELRTKWRNAIARSFVEKDNTTVWCPIPDCNYCVEYRGGGTRDVRCVSGHEFCFKCARTSSNAVSLPSEPHGPANCQEVFTWAKRETDNGENAKWLLANTKPCPKCKRSIEKNQGCNHMTCRTTAGGCGFEFCWMCLVDWHKHNGDGYSCNRRPDKALYDESIAKNTQDELIHFTFYYDRYVNQIQAEKHACKARERITVQSEVIASLLSDRIRPESVKFMEFALDTIILARRVAKWAYVHAFFQKTGPYLTLFENSQALLEEKLETLQEKMELKKIEDVIQGGDGSNSFASNTVTSSSNASSSSTGTLFPPTASNSSSRRASTTTATGTTNPPKTSSSSSSSSSTKTSPVASREDMTTFERYEEWRYAVINLTSAVNKFSKGLVQAVLSGEFLTGASISSSSSSTVPLPPTTSNSSSSSSSTSSTSSDSTKPSQSKRPRPDVNQ